MEFSFFHRPKPKQFEYKPRFYKEESEDGKKQTDSEQFQDRLHVSLNRHRNAQPASSPWRTIIGAVACLAFVMYFLCSDVLDNLAKFFTTPLVHTEQDFDPQGGFATEDSLCDTVTEPDTTTGVYL